MVALKGNDDAVDNKKAKKKKFHIKNNIIIGILRK